VLIGPYLHLPRLLVVVVGSLTTVAAYLLGREWGGRLAGLLAAVLVAANPVHVLINSHVAWSNSITPLFTTLGLWQLSRAVRQLHGPSLAWAAAFLALGLLTHPSVFVLLPACAVYLVWRAPGLIRSRWPWLAAAVFVVIYSPMLVYNLLGNYDSLRSVARNRLNAVGRPFGPDVYLDNLLGFGSMLLRTAAGAIQTEAGDLGYLHQGEVWLWLALGLAAITALVRRGEPLPLLAVLSTPLFGAFYGSDVYEPIFQGRYVMPAVVCVFAAIGAFLAREASSGKSGPTLRTALAGLATLVLVVQPLLALANFRDDAPSFNRALIAAVKATEAAREPGEEVMLDRRLHGRQIGGGWRLDRAFEMGFTIRDIPFRGTDLHIDTIQAMLARRPSVLAVLDRDSVAQLPERFALSSVADVPLSPAETGSIQHGVYRIAMKS